jgi:hypothetical protein
MIVVSILFFLMAENVLFVFAEKLGGWPSNLTAVFKRAVRQTGSFPAIVSHTRCLIVFPLEEKNPANSRVPVQWFLARTLLAVN